MASEDQKNIAEMFLAYAKILALIAAGGWTWYQWDKTIFPKQQWDQSARISSARVDLKLGNASFKVGSLIHKEVADTSLIQQEEQQRQKYGVPTIMVFDVPLTNDRPFPIQLEVTKVSFRKVDAPKSGAKLIWSKPTNLKVNELFGIKTPPIIETGGNISLSSQHVTTINWCCETSATKPVKLIELSIELTLQGIDPITSNLIPKSKKTRRMNFVALITEDMSAFDSNTVAGKADWILNTTQSPLTLDRLPPT